MPEPAPVTMTTLPVKRSLMGAFSGLWGAAHWGGPFPDNGWRRNPLRFPAGSCNAVGLAYFWPSA
jgi:hypothetical protein